MAPGLTTDLEGGPAEDGAVDAAQPLIVFVHVPRTAGITVRSVFVRSFSKRAIRSPGDGLRNPERALSGVRKLAASPDPAVRVVAGPIPYGFLRPNLPADTRYVTVLREPVDRVLSHYFRLSQSGGPPAREG